MARLSLVPAEQETTEVDICGTVFKTVPVTRSRQRALGTLDEQLNSVEGDDDKADDKRVEIVAKMLDCILEPAEGDSKASALIVEKWKADELAFRWLFALLEQLAELSADPS